MIENFNCESKIHAKITMGIFKEISTSLPDFLSGELELLGGVPLIGGGVSALLRRQGFGGVPMVNCTVRWKAGKTGT